MNKLHKLKIEKVFADKKLVGYKPWEWRVDDRGFAPGDFVLYSVNGCHDHDLNKMIFQIIYVLKIDEKHCVFTDRKLTEALKPVENQPDENQLAEPWKPQDGEKFFCVGGNGKVCSFVKVFENDKEYISFGNCFRTREEAEAARERVRSALKGEALSKTEKVESLDGHELSDAEKGVIRILRRCKIETMWNCPFVYPESQNELSKCDAGVLFEFESGAKAREFGDLADDVIAEAEERREKGEPSW